MLARHCVLAGYVLMDSSFCCNRINVIKLLGTNIQTRIMDLPYKLVT